MIDETHTPDHTTEEKIKEAARKLFTQKGFAAVKTRDIASEAGINLALLNYYFRSKEKLFDLIMLENLQQFAKGIAGVLVDDKKTIDEKIQTLVNSYIDMLTQNPDLPLFVLNEMRRDPSNLPMKMDAEIGPVRSQFMMQIRAGMDAGEITPMHPLQLWANIIALIVFPFAARPMLKKVTNIDDEQFLALMQERKKMIPVWINAIMKAKLE